MKKIITLFQRNYETDRLVRDEVTPGAEWVIAGEGVATRKWDGSCCMVRSGKLYRRYELKRGKSAPPGFEPMQEPDEVTGATPGWVPVGTGPEDKWFRAALTFNSSVPADGTYEAIGPHFGGGHHGGANPEECSADALVRHGVDRFESFPRSFDAIRDWFLSMGTVERPPTEGVVWHHPDGRMVKIKARDFGVERKTPASLIHSRPTGVGRETP